MKTMWERVYCLKDVLTSDVFPKPSIPQQSDLGLVSREMVLDQNLSRIATFSW